MMTTKMINMKMIEIMVKMIMRMIVVMVTMITMTRTTRRGKRVARSGGTMMMTPPLPWAAVAHCHHLMK